MLQNTDHSLGIKQDKGEEVTTVSAGSPAQAPQDSAGVKAAPTPAKTMTGMQGMPGLHLIPHISVRCWDR